MDEPRLGLTYDDVLLVPRRSRGRSRREVSTRSRLTPRVEEEDLVGGLRSGMSYVDAETVPEFWEKARFVRQTEAGERESHPGQP